MSTLSLEAVRQISVAQYHSMIENGILGSDDRLELLDGYLVDKIPNNPTHYGSIQLIEDALDRLLPAGSWCFRVQGPITLSKSEPEPDLVVAHGGRRDYLSRHPGPQDVLLLVEVADSTLKQDQTTKQEIYARASIGVYWIVNLVQNVVEVYTMPTGPQSEPVYRRREVYNRSDMIPLEFGGKVVANVPVADMLP